MHFACTGKDNGLILDNFKHLSEVSASIEVRIPLVVGYNDGEIDSIGAFLSELRGIKRVKVLRYHSFSASRYRALSRECTLPEPLTTERHVRDAVSRLRSYGIPATDGKGDTHLKL